MNKNIYREIEKYLTLKDFIIVYLSCGHSFRDSKMNRWKIGDKVACKDCLSDYEILQMYVIIEDDE